MCEISFTEVSIAEVFPEGLIPFDKMPDPNPSLTLAYISQAAPKVYKEVFDEPLAMVKALHVAYTLDCGQVNGVLYSYRQLRSRALRLLTTLSKGIYPPSSQDRSFLLSVIRVHIELIPPYQLGGKNYGYLFQEKSSHYDDMIFSLGWHTDPRERLFWLSLFGQLLAPQRNNDAIQWYAMRLLMSEYCDTVRDAEEDWRTFKANRTV